MYCAKSADLDLLLKLHDVAATNQFIDSASANASSKWSSLPAFIHLMVSQFLTVSDLLSRVEMVNKAWSTSRRCGWSTIATRKLDLSVVGAFISRRTKQWRSKVRVFDAPTQNIRRQENHISTLRNLTSVCIDSIDDDGLKALSSASKLTLLRCWGECRKVSDAGFAHIAHLSHLGEFELVGSTVTNAGLAHLSQLHELRSLALFRCKSITSLQPISSLANLRDLGLGFCSINDVGLQHTCRLTQLQTLYLHENPITDACLAHPKPLKTLSDLWIGRCRLRGPGLVHIASLPLRKLFLGGNTEIGDSSLALLKPLSETLLVLGLCSTKVTDVGLPLLSGMHKLHALAIWGCAGIKSLAAFDEGFHVMTMVGIDERPSDAVAKEISRLGSLRPISLSTPSKFLVLHFY